jgi:hypothetical protein
MSNTIYEVVTDYVTNVNKMFYNMNMEFVKATQEFATQAAKAAPYKDPFGFMDLATKKSK